MNRLVIGVDARPLSSRVSGVARVISRILMSYPRKQDRFILYAAGPCHSDYEHILRLPGVEWRQGQGALAWKQGLWFNAVLPLVLRRDGLNGFWGSQQVLPPFLPAGLPSVLTFYDLVAVYFPGSMRTIARVQQKVFLNYSVRRANRILCISDQSRLDMIRELGVPEERTATSLLGVDPVKPRRVTLPCGKRPFILGVSTLEPRKNFGMLLDAYELYAKSARSPHHLILAGRRGWESPEFYAKLARLEAAGLVHVMDSLDDESISFLYSQCSFFVMPSLYEGFGLPLLEAMSHDRFCLASDLGCFHEIGGKAIRYLPAEDTNAWAHALTQTAAKTPRMKKFSWKQWSWDRTAGIHAEAFASSFGA